MSRAANEHMARRVANQVLADLGIQSYPIDPVAVAGRLGLIVDEVAGFPPHSFGALSLINGGFRILVSDACPTEGHRRFTVSHEIGHASIDGHVEGMQWIDQEGEKTAFSVGHYRSSRDPVEVEADHFASELLMPAQWVRPLVDSLPIGLEAIRTLADRFGTSLSCAAVRYAQLSAAPVVVTLTRGDAIEWVSASHEIRQAGFFQFNATRTATIPLGSATRRLGDSLESVYSGRQDSSTDFLNDWFSRAPKRVTVEVDALGLGSYGRVLSLLICHDLPETDELYLQEQLGDDDSDTDRDWRSQMRREAGYG